MKSETPMKYAATPTEAQEPLTLEAVKAHLRILPDDTSEDEDILQPLIVAAREFCENYTGAALIPQRVVAFGQDLAGRLQLPRPPVVEVESVTVDGASVSFTASPQSGTVLLPEGLRGLVEVTYRAGYEQLPAAIRQAMLLLVGHWYANREAVALGAVTTVEIELTARTLLNQYKEWWF